jgi:hypothetical protein
MLDEKGRFIRATVNGHVFELIPDTLFNYDTLERLQRAKVTAWYWNLGYRYFDWCNNMAFTHGYEDLRDGWVRYSTFFHVREIVGHINVMRPLIFQKKTSLGWWATIVNVKRS